MNSSSAFTTSLFASPSTQAKSNLRKEKDVHKLLVSEFEVQLPNGEDTNEIHIIFEGPPDSPYKGVSAKILFSDISNYRASGM